jgi:hypothetical protein
MMKSSLWLGLLAIIASASAAPPPEPAAPPPPPDAQSEESDPSAPISASTLSPLATAPDWTQLSQYSKCLTRAAFETVLREVYLEKDRFPTPWIVGPESVKVQTGQPNQPFLEIAFARSDADTVKPIRFWKSADELPPLQGRPPLSDLHIAIDAGHIGGGYGVMEERHLSFQPGESIQEGDLTLLTAQVLEQRLRAHGAIVSQVRPSAAPVTKLTPDQLQSEALAALQAAGFTNPKDRYEGITGEARLLTVQWQSEKLFYRVSEIHARAAKVNHDIKPDMVLCLHYNAEAWGDANAPQFSPVDHLHLLLNGCYSPSEVAVQDTRFELFQRIFSQTHAQEAALAGPIMKALAASTGLPPYRYTTAVARMVQDNPYVYARNLLANRIYQCPVLYFEPYVMNHENTYRRLLLGHWVGRTLVNGRLQTSAVEDYVQGIVQGLLDYYLAVRSA